LAGQTRGPDVDRLEHPVGIDGHVTIILDAGSGDNWKLQATSDFMIWETLATFTTAKMQFTDTSARGLIVAFTGPLLLRFLVQ
jgi:hypothetical protein